MTTISLDRHALAEQAEQMGLITWRQIPRVKRGQPVLVEGNQLYPEDLQDLIRARTEHGS